jgi:hypothetical protein
VVKKRATSQKYIFRVEDNTKDPDLVICSHLTRVMVPELATVAAVDASDHKSDDGSGAEIGAGMVTVFHQTGGP